MFQSRDVEIDEESTRDTGHFHASEQLRLMDAAKQALHNFESGIICRSTDGAIVRMGGKFKWGMNLSSKRIRGCAPPSDRFWITLWL